ncbi:hypothetical protein CJJ23_03215 [Mycoplasmopsis agassizii]|uniref:Uncharacterized protein n=1 Tax=Mycoplasmopsis agassizii TaxID=33922 RepID=A0A269TIC4_9BACT|nr:hypothetical protein [Mycoplasmopsis agassizii]PAK21194.1 hypothetical protein CJJ23_03215 [Mycoplasmopsis agassizii]
MDDNFARRLTRKSYPNANSMIQAFVSAKNFLQSFYKEHPVENYSKIYDVIHSIEHNYFKKLRAVFEHEKIEITIVKQICSYLRTRNLKHDNLKIKIDRDGTVQISHWHSFYLQVLQNYEIFEQRDEYINHFNADFMRKEFSKYQEIHDLLSNDFHSSLIDKIKNLMTMRRYSINEAKDNVLDNEIEKHKKSLHSNIQKLFYKYHLNGKGFEFEIHLNNKKGVKILKWPAYEEYQQVIKNSNFFNEDTSLFNTRITLKHYLKKRGLII